MLSCDRCRAAVSAQMDGERGDVAPGDLAAHLRACRRCRHFAGALHDLDTALPADDLQAPDRSAQILAAVRADRAPRAGRAGRGTQPSADRTSAGRAPAGRVVGGGARHARREPAGAGIARVSLALVAVLQALGAAVELAGTSGAHTLRDLGAFQLALAVGFLVAAVRPSTAAGLLPTAAALALALLAVVALDVNAGQATTAGELAHVTELLGVALVWLIARGHVPGALQHA